MPKPEDLHETIEVRAVGADLSIRWRPPNVYHEVGLWWLAEFDVNICEINPENVAAIKAAFDECLRRIEAEGKQS